MGENHSTFRDQERVIQAIAAAAKDRVKVMDYGRSVEGRPLRIIAVTAPESMAKIEAIRARIAKLADPRTLSSGVESDDIVRNTPVITWINHCIHGDESASFESAMWSLYTLGASESPEIMEALRNSVVILNPVFNPDGHERFVVFYNSVALGSPEQFAYEKQQPWAISGRFNHYRFDMNRDKLTLTQPESRQESAAYLHWNPQVMADEHGQPENYFFPPNSMPANRNVDRARINHWTDVFGRANGAAFDKYGWTYVTRETFDFYGPFYLDSWAALNGSIGMTYETDGGGNLARRRSDDTISTLRDAIAHHFETTMATIQTAAKNREALLRDFLAFHRGAIEEGKTGKMRRIVIRPDKDPGRAAELAANLLRAGIEVQESRGNLHSETAHAYVPPVADPKLKIENRNSQDFPPGSLIVDLAQPQGHMARAYLEPDADFEPEFVKEQIARRERNEKKNENEPKEGYEFYDITAWALPFAYGLDAWWTEDAPPVDSRKLTLDARGNVAIQSLTGGVQGGRTQVAYVFKYDRDSAAFLALRLLLEDYKLAVATKPLRAGGKDWPRGTIIARVVRNPESLHKRIESLAGELGVEVFAINSGYGDDSPVGLGSDYVNSLKRPSIVVIEDDFVDHASFGSVWHLLERQAGVTFTPMRIRRLLNADLSRFNVIVFPDGGGYAGALGKTGLESLKAWAAKGGVLIGLGGGGLWFTEKEVGITTASRVGAEDTHAASVAGTPAPATPTGSESKSAPKKPKKPLNIPGAIMRAKIDPTHFLGFGYESGEIPVRLDGDVFLKPSTKGSNPVSFGKGPSLLSGYIWPGNTEELLAETAYVVDEPIGNGHAILFLNDPTFRASWPGLRKLFLSGILFGTGMEPLTLHGGRE